MAGFDAVALRTTDPERRATARELARLARRLKDQRVRFVFERPSTIEVPKLVTSVAEDDEPSAGRAEFIAMTTLVSFYSGFVLNVLLDVDDFRLGTAIVAGTTAAGVTGSLFGSRGRRITGGMASAYSVGVLLGGGNAALLAEPFGLLDGEDQFMSFLLVGLAAGGIGGLLYSDSTNPTRAQMTFTGTLSYMGLATAGLSLLVAQPDDIEVDTVLLLLAAGLDVGAGVGLALSPKLDWSKSRGNLVWLSSFLGAVAGFGVVALVAGAPDSDTEGRFFAASTLGGMWGGFGLGVHLTRNMKPDPRFAHEDGAPTTAVVPTIIDQAPGLAVMGSF